MIKTPSGVIKEHIPVLHSTR